MKKSYKNVLLYLKLIITKKTINNLYKKDYMPCQRNNKLKKKK